MTGLYMRWMAGAYVAIGILFCTWLALPNSASAYTVSTLTYPVTRATEVRLVPGLRGESAAVWIDSSSGKSLVFFGRTHDGQPFYATRSISDVNYDSWGLQLAMDAQGTAHITWLENDNGTNRLMYSSITSSEAVSPAIQLNTVGDNVFSNSLALGADQSVHVAWEGRHGPDFQVQHVRIAPDGTASGVHQVSTLGFNVFQIQIAIDATGVARVFWQRYINPNNRIQYATVSPAGVVGSTENLSAAGTHSSLGSVAGDVQGNTHVVWSENGNNEIHYRRVNADGSLGDDIRLSRAGDHASNSRVVVSTNGVAHAVWVRATYPTYTLQYVHIAADQSVGPIIDANTDDTRMDITGLSVDADQNLYAVWTTDPGQPDDFMAWSGGLNADDSAMPVRQLSDPAGSAVNSQVAVDELQNAHFAWVRKQGLSSFSVQYTKLASVPTRSPDQITFEQGPVASESAMRSITIANSVVADLKLGVRSLEVLGAPSGVFRLTRGTCSAALPPGQECTLQVTFTPAAAQHYEAMALVYVTGSAEPLRVRLVGVGFEPKPEPPTTDPPTACPRGTSTSIVCAPTAGRAARLRCASGGINGLFMLGTARREQVRATAKRDLIISGGGGDSVRSFAGNDSIWSGAGNDHIDAGTGADCVRGGHGNDTIVGGPGRDTLSGGSGNDRILARDGARDIVSCGSGRRDIAIVDRLDRVHRSCEIVRRR